MSEDSKQTIEDVLGSLLRNPKNTARRQEIIEIANMSNPIVTLYPRDRYAEFHGEFTQTAQTIAELKQLLAYLEREKYRINLT